MVDIKLLLNPHQLLMTLNTWSTTSARLKQFPLDLQHTLTHFILCQENNPAAKKDLARYFGNFLFPGTTSIGERKRNPEIFQDTSETAYEDYYSWINRNIRKTLEKMKDKGGLSKSILISEENLESIIQKVIIILEFETIDGIPLCEAIPHQMYEDIFIRILMLLINVKEPVHKIHLYIEFNAICHRISLALIDWMEKEKITSKCKQNIYKLVKLAVLSGYVGINLKSSASAASALLNRNLIPLKKAWIQDAAAAKNISEDEIGAVVRKLLTVSRRPEGSFGLESISQYYSELIETKRPISLIFFCDDYLESVIDMKRFEVMLKLNQNLKVLFIPRGGRYGNDLAYEDIDRILHERQFCILQKFFELGRFCISINGPKSGCIDPCVFR